MAYISVSIGLNDIATETNSADHMTELLNEWGRLENGTATERNVIDMDELDAYGVTMIEAMHNQLTKARAKGWTP